MCLSGRWIVATAVAIAVLLPAGPILAQDEAPVLRVVNTDEMPGDIAPDRVGLSLLASLDPGEYPRLFTDCCDLSVAAGNDVRCYEPDMNIGRDLSLVTVMVDEGTPLNFTTTKALDESTRCDGAVVDGEDEVTCFDRQVIVDYERRTVSFVDMPALSPGDTLILFVEDAPPCAGRQENTGRNYDCG